jgi:hypothetical protein
MAPDDATRAALRGGGAVLRGAAPAIGVPADVATLLARLSLSSYAPALCGRPGLSSVAAAVTVRCAGLEWSVDTPMGSSLLGVALEAAAALAARQTAAPPLLPPPPLEAAIPTAPPGTFL